MHFLFFNIHMYVLKWKQTSYCIVIIIMYLFIIKLFQCLMIPPDLVVDWLTELSTNSCSCVPFL